MKKKLKPILTMCLAIMMIITACAIAPEGPVDDGPPAAASPPPPTAAPGINEPGGFQEVEEGSSLVHPALLEALENFPAYTVNADPVLPRGTGSDNVLRVGVGSDTTFIGLMLGSHTREAYDMAIADLMGYTLVSWDEKNLLTNNGIATFDYDRATNIITLEMQYDVYWHDGLPLTLDDLVYAYELIAHPEYTSTRFDASSQIPNVIGIEEYRSGEADSISGLRLSNNNRTLQIHYDEPLPPAALFAGSIWLRPVPRHFIAPAIAEVGHENIESHPRARDEYLGFGPFKIETVVPGESYYLVPNDNYFRGAPLIDGILINTVALDMVPSAMRAGEYDIMVYHVRNVSEYNLMQPTNYQLLGWPTSSGNFFNFRLGYFEPNEDGTGRTMVVRDDDAPITNIAIRRALAHSIDRQTVADVVGNGLWIPATSILHPFNAGTFIDLSLEGFVFDLELANQILDDAGFTERDAEGMRLDLNGERMTLVYAAHFNATNEVLVPLNLQNWRSIGLRVDLYGGDFMDWTLFLDTMLWSDDLGPGIDMFMMGWSFGLNPAPHSLWDDTAQFNMPRYTSPTFKQILADIASQQAWDSDFLADAYSRWEQAFFEELPAAPWTWNLDVMAVNNRVANVSRLRMDNGPFDAVGNWDTVTWGSHLVGLTASAPYVDGR